MVVSRQVVIVKMKAIGILRLNPVSIQAPICFPPVFDCEYRDRVVLDVNRVDNPILSLPDSEHRIVIGKLLAVRGKGIVGQPHEATFDQTLNVSRNRPQILDG